MGDVVPLFVASNGATKKERWAARGHRRPPIEHFTHNNQPKTGGRDGGEYGGKVRQVGGAGGARYHCFGGALELNGGKKLKK